MGGVSASLTHVCHALSLVRKVLSMAVLKILFNRLQYLKKENWQQAMILPQKVNVPNWTDIGDSSLINGYNSTTAHFKSNGFIPVYGIKNGRYIVKASDGVFDIVDPAVDYGKGESALISIDAHACQIQNGGVISLLTQLHQGFQCVFTPRKAVRTCL